MANRSVSLLLCAFIATGVLMASDWWVRKPYNRWSKDECRKMLEDSPWAATQTSQILGPYDSRNAGVGINIDLGQSVSYHVRFLTAKPVRMAIARQALIDGTDKANEASLAKFVDNTDVEDIVVAVAVKADYRFPQFRNLLIELRTPDLINNTYLETDKGSIQYLKRYDPPGDDGIGAKFTFARRLPDGRPLVTSKERKIRFETGLSLDQRQSVRNPPSDFYGGPDNSNRISIQFDLRKMVFNGRLEI